MGFNNILVAFNGGEASRTALDFAIWYANRNEAHLTGILAHGASQVTKRVPYWLSESLKESMLDIMANRMADIGEAFHAATSGALPAERCHWLDIRDKPDASIARYARLYDLTILGQYEDLLGSDELVLHPERIAYASGRPALLIPRRFEPDTQITRTAVVAWDGGKRAARAFYDALPILRLKDRVILTQVRSGETTAPTPAVSIGDVLARGGLKIETCIIEPEGSIANTLLSLCEREKASILVMGAYEHSKLAEDFLGGVTDEIAHDVRIPVFMSH